MASKGHEKHEREELSIRAPRTGALVSTVPDYLAIAPEGPIRGAENMEPGDFIMPRLTIAGKQSPQMDENNERYMADLKMGQFFNSVTREVYGPEIYVVPLFEAKTRSRNRPYGEDGPPFCVSTDGKRGDGDPGGECKACPERNFTRDGKGDSIPPSCTEIMNYVVMLMPGRDVPKENGNIVLWSETPRIDTVSVIAFKRTSIGSAKNWNTLLRLRNRDWFAGIYRMKSVAQTDGKNSWYIPMVENAGWQSEDGYRLSIPAYESFRNMFDSGRARVDEFVEREPGDEA